MGKSPPASDEKRRKTMSLIKSKDTVIEVLLRKALWASGIRYRKNYSRLPGKPDIAITKHRIAIFCDGEFWHGKDWEIKKPRLKHNREFWINKIERNMTRDCEIDKALMQMDWTVIRFWGLAIKRNLSACIDEIKSVILSNEIEKHYSTSKGETEGETEADFQEN